MGLHVIGDKAETPSLFPRFSTCQMCSKSRRQQQDNNNNSALFLKLSYLIMAVAEQDWSLTDESTGKTVNAIFARLEQNMSDPNYARTLRRSPYERAKACAVRCC